MKLLNERQSAEFLGVSRYFRRDSRMRGTGPDKLLRRR